ncbi:MAG: DUF5668 domain-containing protein [Bacillota bacterium]
MNTARFINGLLIIGIGFLLLLNTLGIISWTAWNQIWRLWPVLLILVGISILFRGRLCALGGLVGLVVVAAVIFGVFWLGWGSGGSPSRLSIDQEVPEHVSAAIVALDFSAGRVEIGANTSGRRITGEISYYGFRPVERVEFQEYAGGYRLDYGLEHKTHGQLIGNRSGQRWSLRLPRDVVLDLLLDNGACSGLVDLRQLAVATLSINMGASDLEIRLGDQHPLTKVSINAGASSISVHVPASAGVRITMETAVGSNNFSAIGLVGENGVWTTPGYAEAATKIEITMKAAVSNLKLYR